MTAQTLLTYSLLGTLESWSTLDAGVPWSTFVEREVTAERRGDRVDDLRAPKLKPAHICTGTGLTPVHICTGTVLTRPHLHRDCAHPPTSAPGLLMLKLKRIPTIFASSARHRET